MRALNALDARAMAAIHAESFDTSWDALEMSAHVAKDFCVGFGEPLQAFAILSVAADQAEILTIATSQNARRQGLAAHLLSEACADLSARGVTTLFLEVAEDNAAAQGLYRQLGFEPIGRRPAYYRRASGRVAALTFCKKLDGTGRAA